MLYAVANSCIGATPAAFAADVMPQSVSGFGLGMFRCAGDIGARLWPDLQCELCVVCTVLCTAYWVCWGASQVS